jgi:type IV secretion system protein VirB2
LEIAMFKKVQNAKTAGLLAVLMVLSSPAFAGGGGFGRVQEVFDDVNNVLIAAGVSIMTMAILWCGYKVTFRGASFEDISKPLIGGIILGTAPVLAGFLMT